MFRYALVVSLRWDCWKFALATLVVLGPLEDDAPKVWIRGEYIQVTEDQKRTLYDLGQRFIAAAQPLSDDLARLDQTQRKLNKLRSDYELETWQTLTQNQKSVVIREQRSAGKKILQMHAPFLQLMTDWTKHALRTEIVRIHEGFPRNENGDPPTIDESIPHRMIAGYAFRPEPVTLGGDIEQDLLQVVQSFRSYEPWGGNKMCGGFHPDFCMEFIAGEDRAYALVCLTCSEADIVLPDRKLRVDLHKDAHGELEGRLLEHFPNQRKNQ